MPAAVDVGRYQERLSGSVQTSSAVQLRSDVDDDEILCVGKYRERRMSTSGARWRGRDSEMWNKVTPMNIVSSGVA